MEDELLLITWKEKTLAEICELVRCIVLPSNLAQAAVRHPPHQTLVRSHTQSNLLRSSPDLPNSGNLKPTTLHGGQSVGAAAGVS